MLIDSMLERWLFFLEAKGLHPAAALCLIAVCTANAFAGRVLNLCGKTEAQQVANLTGAGGRQPWQARDVMSCVGEREQLLTTRNLCLGTRGCLGLHHPSLSSHRDTQARRAVPGST